MVPFLQSTTAVGLLLTDEYFYAVEVTLGRGEEYRFVRRARVPTPRGAYVGGTVMDIDLVSHSLRELWRSGGFTSRRVVLGLPAALCSWRRMDLPPASRDEQLLMLRNELEPAGFFDPERHVLDFIPLHLPPSEDGVPIAAVMVEEQKVQLLREALHQAGLALEAAEPLALSLLRLTVMGVGSEEVVAVALVSPGLAELLIVEAGAVRFQRRIVGEWQPATLTDAMAEEIEGGGALKGLNLEENAHALLGEVRRSLVFCQRLAPDLPMPGRLLLVTDEPDLEGFLAVCASTPSSLPCGLLETLVLPRLPVLAQEQLAGRGVSGYLLTLGLALRRRPGLADGVRVDLSKSDERLLLERRAPEIRLRALVLVLVWLLVNVALWFGIAQVRQMREGSLVAMRRAIAQMMESMSPYARQEELIRRAAQNRLENDVWPERWLAALEAIASPEVQVTALQLNKNEVVLSAKVARTEAALEYSRNLGRQMPLAASSLPTVIPEADGTATFHLTGKLTRSLASAEPGSDATAWASLQEAQHAVAR